MRVLLIIILFTFVSCIEQKKLGKAVIVELVNYESYDEYFPHDFTMNSEFILENKFELRNNDGNIIIVNNNNNGFTGHYITLKLNPNLEIIKAEYDESTDVIDGSETTFKVDSVDLKLNSNPFYSKDIIGYYSIYLTQNYFAGKLKELGVKDEIIKREFKGKFKTYEE